MASIQKRTRVNKNGTKTTFWIARWHDKKTGKNPTQSFPKKGLAEEFLRGVEADIHRGEYISPDDGKVTFGEYSQRWLDSRTYEESTGEMIDDRLRLHVLPELGTLALKDIRPTTIQKWIRGLTVARNYREVLFQHVSSIMNAAVDDELIRKNPCNASSVKRPGREANKIHPWSADQVVAMRDNMNDRYRIVVMLGVGLGLRQGEIFGISPSDFDFERRRVMIQRQVKMSNTSTHNRYFSKPKGGKEREVPLPDAVAEAVREHLIKYPAQAVTMPWGKKEGPRITVDLLVTTRRNYACRRDEFNRLVWRKARIAAGIPEGRENGCHMLRHVYASTLLHAGESVVALAAYLGHSDPGFTLRTYTHLLPESDQRTRDAVDAAFGVTGV